MEIIAVEYERDSREGYTSILPISHLFAHLTEQFSADNFRSKFIFMLTTADTPFPKTVWPFSY